MIWLWILFGVPALLLLVLIGGAAYMYRFGLSRRPFPWSKEYRDPWAKRPSEPRLVDGVPFNPNGWGDAIVKGEQWMYDTYHERGRRFYTISYDGLKLAADYFPPEGESPRAIILLAHGYRSGPLLDFSISTKEMLEMNLGCFIIHQRAHWASEGDLITFGVRERYDVRDWACFLEKEFPGVPVILDGLSMGAATVMAAAALDLPVNLKGIIADCGYTSMRGIFDKIIREWFHLPPFPLVHMTDLYCRIRHGFGFSDVNCAETLAHAKVPVLLAHGQADSFVPHRMAEEIYGAVKDKIDITFFSVPEADHGLSYLQDNAGYRRLIGELLDKCLKDNS
jgi:fermentation-respiration switch protein FrsA (DUF1100 family)